MRRLWWLIAGAYLSGCASAPPDSHQTISVVSEPPGATATLRCHGVEIDSGTTPAKLELSRSETECRVAVVKEGFLSESVDLKRRPRAAAFLGPLAVLPAAAQGVTTEAELAAWLSKYQDQIKVVLRRKN